MEEIMKQNKMPELVRWTDASIYCYERNCICEGCVYNEHLETKCIMKNTVLELFKKFGKPEDSSLRLKKKQLFIVNYHGQDAQKLLLINKMKELKHKILSDCETEFTDCCAEILNIIDGLILSDNMEAQIKEIQMLKADREINLIHQKKFRERKNQLPSNKNIQSCKDNA